MPGLVPGMTAVWAKATRSRACRFDPVIPLNAKPMPAITLRYTSARSEVWEWYWILWRKKLWIHHTYYLVCMLVIAISLDGRWPPHKGSVLLGLLIAAVIIASFVAFPQLMFKPEERTLTASEGGIATRIGNKSASLKWEEIAAIQDRQDIIAVVGKSGRAFLIPRRAFSSEKERSDFLTAVKSWQAHNTG